MVIALQPSTWSFFNIEKELIMLILQTSQSYTYCRLKL